jgi:Cd2+/Zn2+-exporting ATPase
MSVDRESLPGFRDDLAHHVQPAESGQAQQGGGIGAWTRRWLIERIKTTCTVVALVTMLLGLTAEYFAAPTWLVVALYTSAYLSGGIFGLQAGWAALRNLKIDVDLLMVLAALGAAYVGAAFEGAMLLFLFSLSNVLQEYALDRTRNAIRSLMKLRPEQALVRRGSTTVLLPVEQVELDDDFILRPGDRIPLDGVVVAGESTVDQSPITGESMPVLKEPGSLLLAGTINKNGSLEARVIRLAKDSTIAQLISLVEEAQSQKAQTQRFLDRAEQYYALGVIVFTLLTIIVPIVWLQEDFASAFYRAMTLMVAASPCALIISTPASILSAIGNGARRGILFKGGMYVEQAASIKVVAFDKTGTLSEGKPRVTDTLVLPAPTGANQRRWQGDADDLLALAASIEAKSEHALARATLEAATDRRLQFVEAISFQATMGKGVQGVVAEQAIRIGNLRYFEQMHLIGREQVAPLLARLQKEGKTAVLVTQMDEANQSADVLGVIAFADVLRDNAAAVVAELKALGVEHVAMLTGDNERVAAAVAAQAGVDEYYADLLPEDKVRIVKELQEKYGPVAMVGDGVNDAPALATATIGIAMGAAGADVALETADLVLMSDKLDNIPYVIDLSRQTRKTLWINLGFALSMIALMVAAIFAVELPLPLAVIGHEGGTVLVSLNGLRLLLFQRSHISS